MSACVVCRLERFARYLGRRKEGGGEEDGVRMRVGKQEAAKVSSLSSVAQRTGEEARPFPTSDSGSQRSSFVTLANQKTLKCIT